jgi:carboxymethylenebutenolidase
VLRVGTLALRFVPHIYWDQASVLAQLGLIDVATLPVCGANTARKALDPSLPANALIRRAALM